MRGVDGQMVEILGRDRLVAELLRAGLEVALPLRDRGIDLIAYADLDDRVGSFVARPIQMKASLKRSFGVWRKYSKFPDLLLAFVWHLDGAGEPQTFALTVSEATEIAIDLGWTRTASWTENGGYSTTRPSGRLLELLQPHVMTPQAWWSKVTSHSLLRNSAFSASGNDEAEGRARAPR